MRTVWLVVLVLAGCEGRDAPADAADPLAVCEAIREEWAAFAVTVDRSCQDASDCVLIDADDDCEGTSPAIGHCLGTPFNALAYQARSDEADDLRRRFGACAQAAELSGSPDCGGGFVVCDNGICANAQSDFCGL